MPHLQGSWATDFEGVNQYSLGYSAGAGYTIGQTNKTKELFSFKLNDDQIRNWLAPAMLGNPSNFLFAHQIYNGPKGTVTIPDNLADWNTPGKPEYESLYSD